MLEFSKKQLNSRKSKLKLRYNLTPEQYELLWDEQKGRCSLCGGGMNRGAIGKTKPNIDHCHKTGKVRNIVHARCNSIIGMAEDSEWLLKKAKEYIKRHKQAPA